MHSRTSSAEVHVKGVYESPKGCRLKRAKAWYLSSDKISGEKMVYAGGFLPESTATTTLAVNLMRVNLRQP